MPTYHVRLNSHLFLVYLLFYIVVGAVLPTTALSYRKAKTQSQQHPVRRLHAFVNQHLFKKLKFASNEKMVENAIKVAMEEEFRIPEDQFPRFYNIYRSTMMDAINTKRGTCAQIGGRVVVGA